MRVAVLGATGATGRHLVTQALERGHRVDAIVRDPARAALPSNPRLTIHQGDVRDAASVAAAIAPESVVVSGLGLASKKEAGTLTAGARAVVAAHPSRIVWLGAVGTGRSAGAVGRLTALLLRAGFGAEYGDKVTADTTVLDAGGTVLPAQHARATIARLMLDEAEAPVHPGQLIVPH